MTLDRWDPAAASWTPAFDLYDMSGGGDAFWQPHGTHRAWYEWVGYTHGFPLRLPVDELEPGGRPDAADPGPSMLGDIVLCPPFAADQAAAAGHSLGQELALLTVHGVLHLLGYDHAEPDEEKEMFALQRQLLEEWVADQVEAYHQDRQSEKDRRLLDKSQFFDEP